MPTLANDIGAPLLSIDPVPGSIKISGNVGGLMLLRSLLNQAIDGGVSVARDDRGTDTITVICDNAWLGTGRPTR